MSYNVHIAYIFFGPVWLTCKFYYPNTSASQHGLILKPVQIIRFEYFKYSNAHIEQYKFLYFVIYRYLKKFWGSEDDEIAYKEKDLRLEKPVQHDLTEDLAAVGDTGPLQHAHNHERKEEVITSGDKPRKDLWIWNVWNINVNCDNLYAIYNPYTFLKANNLGHTVWFVS